jgi:hypothetical protein
MLDSNAPLISPEANWKTTLAKWPAAGRQWIQLYAAKTNGGALFFGGGSVADGWGIPLYPGASMFLPGPIQPEEVFVCFVNSGDQLYWLSKVVGP